MMLGKLKLMMRGRSLTTRACWVRHWFTVASIDGRFDQYLGDTYAPFQFNEVWGLGEVAFGLKDKIGFTSECFVQAKKDTNVVIEYGCDDGARLFVYDKAGKLVFSKTDSWKIQPYTVYRASFNLKKGIYKFVFDFYEWTAYGGVSFKLIFGDIKPIKI
ncbi:MAG: hypothetical protein QXP29_02735 [Candidatus Nezhaarchaeales archaeon]